MIAATSDDVQPLAILACENFGNTIAMSRQTCDRIQNRVLPTPQPSVIHFLRTVVGYTQKDCATQLGTTQAGVQFLGLAAALISTVGLFRSAEGIWLMVEASASDKRLLPTSRQVKGLLASLESRCVFAGFVDEVLAWQTRIRDWQFGQGELPEMVERSSFYPTSDGLEKLVDAFRQLCRIGETAVTKVSIRTTGSAVVITIMTGEMDDVPPGGIRGPWAGLSQIDKYGKWLLQHYDLDLDLARRATMEIFPSAIHQVLVGLQFSRHKHFDHTVSLDQWPFVEAQSQRPQIDEKMRGFGLSPFLGLAAVTQMLNMLTGGELVKLCPLDRGGLLVGDLPTIKLHLDEMARLCGCTDCAGAQGNMFKRCDRKGFFRKLSIFIADTLALSLFHCPDDLRIHIPISCHLESKNQFRDAIESIITTGANQHCDFTSLLNWAMALVGQDVSKDVKSLNWIMSSGSGQVVWPTIYDTNIIEKQGFLSLSWLRGDLRYKDQEYKLPGLVQEPCNVFPDLRVAWRLRIGDGVLNASLGLEGMKGRYDFAIVSPVLLFANLATALMVDCQHETSAPLEAADRFSSYTGPLNPTQPAALSRERNVMNIGVVAVDGAEDLRLFALACGDHIAPVVIRKAACLRCCLDICRRTNFPVLVL
ncbi:hypothetical protein PVAG01_09068 [Phlyctema vagabunda]|uniref:Uncharacterized protein n=1 Tax=Phlyctema vagabunda TaxID=108571 RepID=A0ABR4P6B2_9HELO